MERLAAVAAVVEADPSSNVVFGQNWQAIRKSRRKPKLAARLSGPTHERPSAEAISNLPPFFR